jgi:hypothetical protein
MDLNIEIVDIQRLKEKIGDKKDGWVIKNIYGLPYEEVEDISNYLVYKDLAKGTIDTMWESAYLIKTPNNSVDLALVFHPQTTVNIKELAKWRENYPDNSWISDYVS